MREERTSRCGWEVLTSSRRQGPNSDTQDVLSSSNTKAGRNDLMLEEI